VATLCGKLGEVYYTRRDLDQAEDMFKKSLEMEETPDNKGAMAKVYGYLGDIYRIRRDLDQAEGMYTKSLALFQAVGAEHMIEIVKTMLANLKKQKDHGKQT
jgi:tetratricopeptide (TPR) repeat protein